MINGGLQSTSSSTLTRRPNASFKLHLIDRLMDLPVGRLAIAGPLLPMLMLLHPFALHSHSGDLITSIIILFCSLWIA